MTDLSTFIYTEKSSLAFRPSIFHFRAVSPGFEDQQEFTMRPVSTPLA